MRDNSCVYFSWDAVAGATEYNLYHAATRDSPYEIYDNVSYNSYLLCLPAENRFYTVSAVFSEGRESTQSKYIQIHPITGNNESPDWTLGGGIHTVTVDMGNFDKFMNIELVCIGEGESVAYSTPLTHVPFTAGYLDPKDYFCNLTMDYAENGQPMESARKTATVLQRFFPDMQKASAYVTENTVRLRWDKLDLDLKYDVLLSENYGTVSPTYQVRVPDIAVSDDPSQLITQLDCFTRYAAIIKTYKDDCVEVGCINVEYTLTPPIDFFLDYTYCANIEWPEDPVPCNNAYTLLETDTGPKTYYGMSTVMGGNLYMYGGFYQVGSGGYTAMATMQMYDPVSSTWTSYDDGPVAGYGGMAALGGRIYIASPAGKLWTFDPLNGPTGKYATLTPTNAPTALASTLVAYNGRLYSFYAAEDTFTIYEYYPKDGTEGNWTAYPFAMDYDNKSYTYSRMAELDGKLYIYRHEGAMMIYDPATMTLEEEKDPAMETIGYYAVTKYHDALYYQDGKNTYTYTPSLINNKWKKLDKPAESPTGSANAPVIENIYGKIYIYNIVLAYGTNTSYMYLYEP